MFKRNLILIYNKFIQASILSNCPQQQATNLTTLKIPRAILLKHSNALFHTTALQQTPVPKVGKAWGQKPPITFTTLMYVMIGGAAMIAAVQSYKQQKMQQWSVKSQETAGKAAVGGPFKLINQDGKPFSDRNLHGEFALLYFGFTHCPDICPDELEKVAAATDLIEKASGSKIQPVFITVDPERDTPACVKKYVQDFHPRMIGLTGDFESIKKLSKAYRVYFNRTTEDEGDYLVDHSIIHYLLDPSGEFVTFYSKNYSAQQLADSVVEHISNWKKDHEEYNKAK